MQLVSGNIQVQGNQIIFTPDQPLPHNSVVYVRVSQEVTSDDGKIMIEGFQGRFTTPLAPMYSSVEIIRSDIGHFLRQVGDEEISWMIHRVSLWADQITFRPYGTVNEGFPGELQQQTDNRIFFHEYTRYESEIRLLMRRTSEHIPGRGQATTIGDFTFREPGSISPEISIVIGRLEKRRDEALRYLRLGDGSYPLPVGTTIGMNARPWPLRPRRSF